MFYTNGALKFTSRALQPKGLGIWYWLQNSGFHSPLPAPLLQPTGVKLSVPNSMGAWVLEVQGYSWGRIYMFMIWGKLHHYGFRYKHVVLRIKLTPNDFINSSFPIHLLLSTLRLLLFYTFLTTKSSFHAQCA